MTRPAITAPPRARAGASPWPIALAAAAVCLIAGVTLAPRGADAEALQLLNRFLARLGFTLFVPIYGASALARLAPGPASRALVRHRRSLGLAYALVMAAHLAGILAWAATPDVELSVDPSTIGGGLGLALIGALAATSSDGAQRRIGARAWRALHLTTIHFLWAIYLVTYLGRVTERGPEYAPGLATVLILAGLRLAAWTRRRRAGRERLHAPSSPAEAASTYSRDGVAPTRAL